MSLEAAIYYQEDCSVLDTPSLEQLLREEERRTYDTFSREVRRRSFVTGRYCAKKAISLLCETNDLSKIAITTGAFNQPVVVCPHEEKLGVSISHCGHSAIAICFPEASPMGIDLEICDKERSKIVSEQLTEKERTMSSGVAVDPLLFSLICWTAKESLSKALRTGLTTPLALFELRRLEAVKGEFAGSFVNFIQYRSVSRVLRERVVSFVLPRTFTSTIAFIEG
jgi:4'-phosphopantetheinyl transferase